MPKVSRKPFPVFLEILNPDDRTVVADSLISRVYLGVGESEV